MPVIFMERSLLDSLTEADIKEIIDENEGHTKYARLEGYYEGDHDILRHRKKDSTAPNNRLVNNMAKYITDTATGYFIGKPVVYSSQNDAYLEALQDIFDYNDEQDENMELAKGASINGDCFEMLYLDEDAQIRFTKVPPDGCIYICETGYNTPMAAIRIVYSKDKDKNIIKKVEFWTAQDCWYFRSINGGALELLDIREHYWGDVPFVEYINNEERQGDFEGVITLIDAYNRVESNTANFFQYNDEALLKVLKMSTHLGTKGHSDACVMLCYNITNKRRLQESFSVFYKEIVCFSLICLCPRRSGPQGPCAAGRIPCRTSGRTAKASALRTTAAGTR